MTTSLLRQGLEFYRWSQRNPIGNIPSDVAKEGAGENRIPFTHYANSVPVYLIFCDLLKKQIKTSASILDIGCGTGRNISFVKDTAGKTYDYFGIDYSTACIAFARSQYKKHGVIFTQHEGKVLPFPTSSFDFVVSSHVLEHIPKQDAPLYVQEISRILKKGGIAVIGTPNRSFCQDLFSVNPSENKKYRLVLPHLHEYYYKEISLLCKKDQIFQKIDISQTTNQICRALMTKGADTIRPKPGIVQTVKFELYSLLRQNNVIQDLMAKIGSEWMIHKMNVSYKDLLGATVLTDEHPEKGDNFIVIAKK